MGIYSHLGFSEIAAMKSVTSILTTGTVARKLLPLSTIAETSYRRYSNQAQNKFDIVVIGGGIVGSASARELILRHPNLKVAIIDKENRFATHQSGNNSGVIHAGIYYKPGSLKAKLCVRGMNLLTKYCADKGIKLVKSGKLIVATERFEIPILLTLYDRGIQNGVKDMKLVEADEITEIEPLSRGLRAIWSPNTAVIDFGEVTESYVQDFNECGGVSFLNFEVKEFLASENPDYPVIISDKQLQRVSAKYVLTCCGLHSDTVALLTGCSEEPKIIPFRGEYLYLNANWPAIPKANIYPVPDPRFPFLGVHVTPRVDGRVILGPNAVLAYCKEGYRYSDYNMKDLKDIVMFPGFRKLALKYAVYGMKEFSRSIFTSLQVKELQRFLVEEIRVKDVEKGPAGVRAQAMTKDGTLVDDFVFDSQAGSSAIGSRVLHCRNAPSPGATSSLAIGEMIADKMEKQFKFKNTKQVEK